MKVSEEGGLLVLIFEYYFIIEQKPDALHRNMTIGVCIYVCVWLRVLLHSTALLRPESRLAESCTRAAFFRHPCRVARREQRLRE